MNNLIFYGFGYVSVLIRLIIENDVSMTQRMIAIKMNIAKNMDIFLLALPNRKCNSYENSKAYNFH